MTSKNIVTCIVIMKKFFKDNMLNSDESSDFELVSHFLMKFVSVSNLQVPVLCRDHFASSCIFLCHRVDVFTLFTLQLYRILRLGLIRVISDDEDQR